MPATITARIQNRLSIKGAAIAARQGSTIWR
jgi:hypothetical protein